MPRQYEVDVPYVLDPNLQMLCQIMAGLEGLSDGRLPYYVTGTPEENPLYCPEPRADGRTGTGAVEVLSASSARKCDLSLKCNRLLKQVSALVEDALGEWRDQCEEN